MFRFVVVLGVGYVLGAKAGRRRYEQISATYRAVTENPTTKAVLDAGRRKVADRLSPDPAMVRLTAIDSETSVLQPEESDVQTPNPQNGKPA
ncbi:MAG: hypothetical protein ACSLE7_17725 [Mycobacterium sp.]